MYWVMYVDKKKTLKNKVLQNVDLLNLYLFLNLLDKNFLHDNQSFPAASRLQPLDIEEKSINFNGDSHHTQ